MRSIFFLSYIFLGLVSIRAQDVHLSQFYETPLMRNPALAGIFTGNVRVHLVHRDQWSWTGFPYRTTTLSGEYKFPVGFGDDYITAGLQTYLDDAGSTHLKTTQVMPAITYHKSLSVEKNRYLSAGFMAGMVQRRFDLNNLSFDSQYTNGSYNPSVPSGEVFNTQNRRFLDMAVGLSYNSSLGEKGNYFIGAAASHLNKPLQSFKDEFIQLERKLQLNVGVHTPLTEQLDLVSEINYLSQGEYAELICGGIISYDLRSMPGIDESNESKKIAVGAGVFYRLKDAFIPVAKLYWMNLEIGISYDVNISSLKTASMGRGGYELSISYKGFFNQPDEGMRQARCPRF